MRETGFEHLVAAPFTYPGPGATLLGRRPDGYRPISRRAVIGQGAAAFADAREALLTWQVQLRSGLRVAASSSRITGGSVAVLTIGAGPFRIAAPVRVVDVIDAPERAAFAYGTLPGHPEAGEECFTVRIDDEVVLFEVSGFSRPSTAAARLGAPVARIAQRIVTDRYMRALRTVAA